ncbi:MAG: hypothetical protein IT379_40910 [Deltaproteobacteria bacterium]|nr:hypothetical protein [Deltaproteobacteria bacterium]
MPVGPVLDGVLDLAHRAGRNALLIGSHGIGKSQAVAAWAERRSLARTEIDLSQLESVGDLIGSPFVRDGRTHLAPPIHLPSPTDRREGIIHLEETLRAQPWMHAAMYSFLSGGALGPTYRVPRGWTVVATANPVEPGGRYDGRALDPAARDRFVVVDVVASLEHWLQWARDGDVHRAVVSFVETSGERVLTDPAATPRGWEHVSKLTHAFEELEPHERSDDALVAALTGCVGNRWARS